MQGTVYAEAFASKEKTARIDIDPAEIWKNKQPDASICADVKLVLDGLNALLKESGIHQKLDLAGWREELDHQNNEYPLSYQTFGDQIPPQYAIQVLDELTKGGAHH
ncbi:putative Acetolactate synthase 1, chloroplastic [Cocos nucifera]|nr:putative Acetolactate synthase 1, chloroplastic [Cocos nucifera]